MVFAAANLALNSPSFPGSFTGAPLGSSADFDPTKFDLIEIFPGSFASGLAVGEDVDGGLGLGERDDTGNFCGVGEAEGEGDGEVATFVIGEEGGVAFNLGLPSRGSIGLGLAMGLFFRNELG